jgi:hypothetical protein
MICAIQFWGDVNNGDKVHAMALARLIADLQPTYRNDMKIMFCARFDTQHDDATVDYVSQKFPTEKFTCKTQVTGWPGGCNKMVGDIFTHVATNCKARKTVDHIFFIEADGVPLRATWLDEINQEYLEGKRMILGAYSKRGDGGLEHVNGNLVMSTNFWKACPDIMHPPAKHAWDNYFKGVLIACCTPSKLIWNDWRLGYGDNPWRGDDYLWEPKRYRDPSNPLYGIDLNCAYHHGSKNGRGIELARKRLLGEKTS